MRKLLNNSARVFGVIAALSAACAFAMTISLPYRIHQGIYTWYLWTERLLPFTSLTALVAMVSALALGISSRQRLPIVLAVMSCALLFFSISHGGVHSGPNPEAWCYNDLRQIEGAKEQLARDRGLTNGSSVTMPDISPLIPAGRELRCANGGTYIINSIGTDARCTVHGSIPEMEANWQKQMRAQPKH